MVVWMFFFDMDQGFWNIYKKEMVSGANHIFELQMQLSGTTLEFHLPFLNPLHRFFPQNIQSVQSLSS